MDALANHIATMHGPGTIGQDELYHVRGFCMGLRRQIVKTCYFLTFGLVLKGGGALPHALPQYATAQLHALATKYRKLLLI